MAVDDAPSAGMVLGGRYRLLRLVGEGGMGRVFLADDEQAGVRVAVKVLADDRPIPKAAQRFEREARSIARIDHANVVRVTDVGQSPRGGLFYVMEYLEGEELATTLEREGPMPWPRVRHLALQICGALQAAHEAGIVHRDLKLENCFRVAREGDPDFVKILDFGVVKLLSPEPDDGGGRLTNTGATMGTPAYMAPELCRGKHVDHRVDVYALGVMIYELLTGSVPFEGDSFLDVALKHMNDPPPPLSEHVPAADLPRGLEAAVMRALSKAREDRFPTMAAFGRALERIDDPEPALIAQEGPAEPLTAPGGTLPAMPAVERRPSGTEPSRPSISASDHAVPVARASASISGATEPSLPHAIADLDDEPAHARPAAWRWLAAGGVAAAGLVAWWMLAAAPDERRSEADAAVVKAEPALPPATKAAPPVPETKAELEAEPSPETKAATEPAPVAAPSSPPAGFSPRQIDAAFQRVQPRVRSCAGALTGGRPGERVRVVVVVDRSTGRVLRVAPSDPRNRSAVESCVLDAMHELELPSGGRGTQTIRRMLTL
jgi:serine/threonine protein kinase